MEQHPQSDNRSKFHQNYGNKLNVPTQNREQQILYDKEQKCSKKTDPGSRIGCEKIVFNKRKIIIIQNIRHLHRETH